MVHHQFALRHVLHAFVEHHHVPDARESAGAAGAGSMIIFAEGGEGHGIDSGSGMIVCTTAAVGFGRKFRAVKVRGSNGVGGSVQRFVGVGGCGGRGGILRFLSSESPDSSFEGARHVGSSRDGRMESGCFVFE